MRSKMAARNNKNCENSKRRKKTKKTINIEITSDPPGCKRIKRVKFDNSRSTRIQKEINEEECDEILNPCDNREEDELQNIKVDKENLNSIKIRENAKNSELGNKNEEKLNDEMSDRTGDSNESGIIERGEIRESEVKNLNQTQALRLSAEKEPIAIESDDWNKLFPDENAMGIPGTNEFNSEQLTYIKQALSKYNNFVTQMVDRKINEATKMINHKMDVLNSEIALLNYQLNCDHPKETDKPKLVRPHPASKILITECRLKDAKRSDSYTEFCSRIVTSFCSVEDMYFKNLRGGSSTINKQQARKSQFPKTIHQEILDTVEYHFKSEIIETGKEKKDGKRSKNGISEVNVKINKKLLQFYNHSIALRSGKLDDKTITQEDREGMRNYDEYFKDPKKFDELDKIISEQQQIVTDSSNSNLEPTTCSKPALDKIISEQQQTVVEPSSSGLKTTICSKPALDKIICEQQPTVTDLSGSDLKPTICSKSITKTFKIKENTKKQKRKFESSTSSSSSMSSSSPSEESSYISSDDASDGKSELDEEREQKHKRKSKSKITIRSIHAKIRREIRSDETLLMSNFLSSY